MPNLNLTWSVQNHCWVKSLGSWFNESGSKRVPRFFRFHRPNSPEGLRAAQAELLPLVAQWQAIRAEARKRGEKYPVWFREKLQAIPAPNMFDLASVAPPDEDDDAAQLELRNQSLARREKLLHLSSALKANEEANPIKPLAKATIQEAKERYDAWYRESGVKDYTAKGLSGLLSAVLVRLDATQPMIGFSVVTVVDDLISRVARREIRARSAHGYARAVKQLCEWYAREVTEYLLPKDWKNIFLRRRFRNPAEADEDVTFSEDAEERDFEVYSTADLKAVFAACQTRRQILYVLLSLNAAMYYVDVARALKTKNVHLDKNAPFLMYRREKESHHASPIIQKVWLWPETAKFLKREMNTETKYPHALLSETGEPMTKRAPQESWRRVRKLLKSSGVLKHRKTIRFTDLRKTGGSAVANYSSIDLAELHLGHKVEGVGARYIKIQKKRLHRPLMAWRDQLSKAGVFAPLKKVLGPSGRRATRR